jgi:translation initiation factor IF-1
MPKNTIGGKKHKQLKNNSSKHNISNITMRDNSGFQFYALVEKFYGHNADVKFIKNESTTEYTSNYNKNKKLSEDEQEIERQKEISIQKEKEKEHVCTSKAIVRGNIAKKCKLKPGDIVLISLRDYDLRKVDLLYKYTEDEYKYLLNNKFLNDSFTILVNNFESSSSSVKYSRNNISVNELLSNNETNKDDVNIVFDDYNDDNKNYNKLNTYSDDDELDEFDNLDDI